MPFIYLIIIILLFNASTLFIKAYQVNNKPGRFSSAYFNLIYGAAPFILLLCVKGFRLDYSIHTLLLAVGVGLGVLIYNGIKIKAVSLGPVAIVSMSYVLGGIFVPAIFGIVFLKESLTVTKGIALLLFVLSFLPIILSQKSSMTLSPKLIACCVGLLLLNGIIMSISKIVQLLLTSPFGAVDYIILYSFFCFMLSLGNIAPSSKYDSPTDITAVLNIKNFFLIVFASLFNAIGSILNIIVQYKLPASVTFPTVQAGLLFTTTITSLIIYREKPNKQTILSLLILCMGIIFISI